MVSAAILTGALLVILGLFFNYFNLMEISRANSIAVSDAKLVLENIRDTTPFSAANVQANYPAGVDLAARFGCNKLPNETVIPAYQGNDPLQITITVSWCYKRNVANRNLSLVTLMTER